MKPIDLPFILKSVLSNFSPFFPDSLVKAFVCCRRLPQPFKMVFNARKPQS